MSKESNEYAPTERMLKELGYDPKEPDRLPQTIPELYRAMNRGFIAIDARFDKLEEAHVEVMDKLGSVAARVEKIDARLEKAEGRPEEAADKITGEDLLKRGIRVR